jgi:hypothetical protein
MVRRLRFHPPELSPPVACFAVDEVTRARCLFGSGRRGRCFSSVRLHLIARRGLLRLNRRRSPNYSHRTEFHYNRLLIPFLDHMPLDTPFFGGTHPTSHR